MLYCISTNTNNIFTPQVFQCLNHMGITVGSANARRCVQLLGSECDAEAMTWKKDIEVNNLFLHIYLHLNGCICLECIIITFKITVALW